MALRKPSEVFKKNNEIISVDTVIEDLEKTSDLNTFSEAFSSFKINLEKIDTFSQTLDTYLSNVEKVNFLSKEVEEIHTELQNYITKENLDRVILSQLLVVEQTIREIQSKIKSINERKVAEIRLDVSNLTEVVNDFITVEIPKYQTDIQDRCENLEENVKQGFEFIEEVVDKNQERVTETVSGLLKKFKDIEILSEKVSNEFHGSEELSEKVSNLHIEIIRNESHIRVQNKNLQAIQEEVKDTLGKINLEEFEEKSYKLGEKIKYLEEVFEKFNEKEILTETILVSPPSTENKDPLTPLDQNFVTLDQLQDHYRLFINRIQQQLATIGGGGETRLKYLDDIVGIATNASVYDGKVLSYNHSIGKFEFITGGGGGNVAISITSTPPPDPQPGNLWYDNVIGRTFLYYQDVDGSQWVDASPSGVIPDSTYWSSTNAGIHTLSNVGIGTTNPIAKLDVQGGDIKVGVNTSSGLILTSPSGFQYRLVVNDSGVLSTVVVP